jgi:hypothetical protein
MDRLTPTPSQPAGAPVPTFRSDAREAGFPGAPTPRHVIIYSRLSVMEAGVACAITAEYPTASVVPAQSLAEVQSSLAGGGIGALRLLAEEQSNKDIANRLGLGVGTVKVHMAHLFAALGARSRVGAVVKSSAPQQRTLETAL